MGNMKGFVMTKQGLVLARVDKPAPKDNEVLVEIKWASVCGSDYPFLAGLKPTEHLHGTVMGHEGAGIVVDAGRAVKGFKKGDFVSMESHRARDEWISAGKDPYSDPKCAIIGHRGFPDGKVPHGTFSEYISVPEVYAHKVPKKVFNAYPASLLEPLGNSIRLLSIVEGLRKPNMVVISGAGPQGLMVALLLKHWLKIKELHVTDFDVERLEMARSLANAKTHTPDKLPDLKPELWLEMSGALPAYYQGKKMLKKGDVMLLFGLPKKEIDICGNEYSNFVLENKTTVLDGVSLIGVCGRLKQDWDRATKIIERLNEKVDLSSLYSYLGPLENLLPLIRRGIIPPKNNSLIKAVFSNFII